MFKRVLLDHLKPGLRIEILWNPDFDRCTVYVKELDVNAGTKRGVGTHVYGVQQLELIGYGLGAPKIVGSTLIFSTNEAGWFSIDLNRLEPASEGHQYATYQPPDVFLRTPGPPVPVEHVEVSVQLAPDPVGEKGVDGPPGPP